MCEQVRDFRRANISVHSVSPFAPIRNAVREEPDKLISWQDFRTGNRLTYPWDIIIGGLCTT